VKHQNVFWGTLLIVIGLLFLFDRLGVFELEWFMVWRLWPVLLILWGVSILPVRGIFKLIMALGVAALSLLIYSKIDPVESPFHHPFQYHYSDNDTTAAVDESQVFNHRNDSVTSALLRMEAGAGEYKLNNATDELVYITKSGGQMLYDFKVEELNGNATVSLMQKSDALLNDKDRNKLDVMLNERPIWDFDIDIGAASFNFDLQLFKVKKIDLVGDATSIKLKFGSLYPETEVNIDAAASSIEIWIPESAGCTLTGSSILSHREIEGFNQVHKGKYETNNFAAASQKININIDAAVSNFKIKRY